MGIDGAAPRGEPDARELWYPAEVAEALYQPFPIPGTARGHVWHHVPATRRPRHFHAEPELNLIAAGRAAFGYGEATISVSAGDLLWWPPGQDHVLLDATPDLDLYVIGVTPAFSEHVLAGRVFRCFRRRGPAAARSRHADEPADGVCRSDGWR